MISFDEIQPEPIIEPSDLIIANTYNDDVEQMVEEQVKSWQNLTAVDSKLPADEYKIEALANLKAAGLLNAAWEKIKNARTEVANAELQSGRK
jgi:hypothetical protein